MKTNSTFLCIVFFTIATFSSLFNTASAQCVAPGMKFKNPVLISGLPNQVGSIYKFPSVISGVDAIVKVTGKAGGATLTSIDDNTYGYSDAWQPVVKTPLTQGAIESYVSFAIDFVKTTDGSSHVFICFTLSAIDVDGDAVHVREMVAANDFSTYGVSNATTLTLANQSGLLKATSTIVNFPGIDTSAYVSNINYKYVNKSKIGEVRIGSVTDPSFTVQDRYSCIYFKPIVIPNVVVLPVQYLSLSATGTNNNIVLNWQTNEKTDDNSFTIERSFDGSSFVPVNTVIEKSAQENLSAYQATDIAPEFTNQQYLYYRIKQTDASGKVSYSNLTYVHLQTTPVEKMRTTPNPFTEKITVQFNSDNKGTAEIHIANIAGKAVISKQFAINKGINILNVDGLVTLTPGIYIARLVVNGVTVESKKIIK
ncbi:T9SS type A sorting domain-containing protein [Ferruginibacter sp. SUN106]|uniref:T9SS type A sorting domain-containing protein n=1 Tax=Ferruginibacter sp. SUN106 TaxID=2978348 RepID=UPI003D36ABA9